MLRNFGSSRAGKPLGYLVNIDFSTKIKVNTTRNAKNNVVRATSRLEAGDTLTSNSSVKSI